MKKKRILYIITRPILGGAQKNVLDLITGFHHSYEVHLAAGFHGHLTESVAKLGVPIHILPNLIRTINPLSDAQAIAECYNLIKTLNPDLVHLHSSKAGLIGRIAGRLQRTPVIFTAHGWGFSSGNPYLRRQIALASEKLFAHFATKIICVSKDDYHQALRKGVGNQHSLVTICYGIPPETPAIAKPESNPPRIVMVARFSEQKDQNTLIKALQKLAHTEATVDFIGSGPLQPNSEALAEQLGLRSRIRFLGDRHDVPQLLAEAQIFVLSTHYEGLPISILEAMRAGLPVVASSVDGIPEEVEQGQTGFHVPPRNAEQLAAKLDLLIRDPALRQRMGAAGREKFLAEFTLERMLTETDALYEQVSKAKKANVQPLKQKPVGFAK